MKTLRRFFDPFIASLLVILVLGILIPAPPGFISFTKQAGNVLVTVLFLVYGARLATTEVWSGIKNWKLQGAVFLSTFLLFPLLGVALHPVNIAVLGPVFAMGTLYLTLLPSTVQSSVTFTSIARGNIAGAVCSATVSNILGIVITPGLVLLIMGRSSGVDPSQITKVLLQLLLPFVIGQLLQPKVGKWLRAHPKLTKLVDNTTILMVVTSAVCGATAEGLWKQITAWQVVLLIASSAVILTIMLLITWYGGRLLGLQLPDRIVLLMCGSKKSLATGLPMASLIFPASTIAAVTVPTIIFHQLQLFVCAIIARQLALHPKMHQPGKP